LGKTTISSALRSLNTGDAGLVIGRKTLGTTVDAAIELLMESGPTSFDGKAWSATSQKLAIFDGTFIAHEICTASLSAKTVFRWPRRTPSSPPTAGPGPAR
jgi:hypothetical protein